MNHAIPMRISLTFCQLLNGGVLPLFSSVFGLTAERVLILLDVKMAEWSAMTSCTNLQLQTDSRTGVCIPRRVYLRLVERYLLELLFYFFYFLFVDVEAEYFNYGYISRHAAASVAGAVYPGNVGACFSFNRWLFAGQGHDPSQQLKERGTSQAEDQDAGV